MHPYLGTKNPAFKARGRQLCYAGLLFVTTSLFAQQAPAPSTTAQKSSDEPDKETVELSPFIVDASQDQGYRATSTLAGSRINTDLRDIAASVTVLTKEFMVDVAAVDINDILTYTANTEGTRDFTASADSLGRPSDDVASSPNTANRVRGLRSADITRDYFHTIGRNLGFDSYNLDQVTISRGPNSILAGLGSAAGIINYSPQYAQLARNRTEVSYRYGSFDDQRATVNSNIVALKDVLALRFAAAWNDRGYQQQPAWYEDQRFYLTGTYKPWKKTTIRASYEEVKIDSRTPNSITPEDGITQWIALGRPTYDSASTAPVSTFLGRGGNQPTYHINSSGVVENAYNDNARYNFTQRNLTNMPIFTRQRLHDNRFYDLHEVNLNPSTQKRSLKVKSLSVDQEILPGLNANVSYVHETGDHEFLNLFRTEYNVLSIDVNKNLPNGQPNPHFLETFMQFRGLDNLSENYDTNEVARGTVAYDLDLRKHNKWLGRYRASAFGEKRKTETEHWQYNAKMAGDLAPESIGYRYYLGGSETRPITSVPFEPALYTAVPYVNATGTTGGPTALTSFYGLKSNRRDLQKLSTSALILQGYFLDDRIVGTYGTRRDKEETASKAAVGGQGGIVPLATPGYGPLASYSDKTTTYGVVVRPLKWLSFHYNKSENFIPIAGAVDLRGNPTPSPAGVGEDYGFSLNLMENKLNVKFNWFELTEANGTADNANFPLAQWEMPYMEQTFFPDLARQGGITYKSGMAPGLITGDSRLAKAYTSDNTAEGMEVELTYNVTRNWRIMAQVSKQEAVQKNIAPDLTEYVEERLAYWRSVPALWTQFTAQNVGWGGGQTGEQYWNGGNRTAYLRYKSAEGKPSTQLAKWHGSIVTNYTFASGPLKGFNFGGAARYIEKPVIGNPAIVDAATGLVTGLDLDNPYFGHARISLDAWVGYRRKIFNDRYDLTLQLNGRDLEENGALRPITANSDGGHPTYRIAQPRTFYLTTTIGF